MYSSEISVFKLEVELPPSERELLSEPALLIFELSKFFFVFLFIGLEALILLDK
jgi:hypothetical protein